MVYKLMLFVLILAIIFVVAEIFDCLINRKKASLGIIPFFLELPAKKSIPFMLSLSYIIMAIISGLTI